ncbi:hypothetical protein PVAP13_7NG144317 [Panicum virgatum]|uniref:Uncharacterized protein n=1 Tax=Panicum virgatum TaxID=38727 RepID=A0A8T0PY58_PANVG|nr:hypothetical protein PVAP13_7NG144317 [Panicum virgatum]
MRGVKKKKKKNGRAVREIASIPSRESASLPLPCQTPRAPWSPARCAFSRWGAASFLLERRRCALAPRPPAAASFAAAPHADAAAPPLPSPESAAITAPSAAPRAQVRFRPSPLCASHGRRCSCDLPFFYS